MRSLVFILVCGALLGAGCAGSAASSRAATVASAAHAAGAEPAAGATVQGSTAPSELAALRERLDDQQQRIVELETRLAMAESAGESLRDELAALRSDHRSRTVRIGAHTAEENAAVRSAARESEPFPLDTDDHGGRPVLRLYGQPEAAPMVPVPTGTVLTVPTGAGLTVPATTRPPPAPTAPIVLPPAVGGDRLPVTSVPESALPSVAQVTAAAPTAPLAVAAAAPAPVAGVEEYQRALGEFNARRFDQALSSLAAFLEHHPEHDYADNALFWRGEIYYARRDYGAAVHEFDAVVRRFPSGNKVADALLKLGLCHRRMGDVARARVFFQRVQREFPGTDAARVASREDAS